MYHSTHPPNPAISAATGGFGKLGLPVPFAIRGVRIRGTLGDIDPLNEVPFKRARSRVKKIPL